MNYAAHYDKLINRARNRILTGYKERHHVIPRCMGGGDEPSNLVTLTAEEHYVAHQLLVKMHPGNHKLVHAAVWMAKQCTGNKAYGWLKRRNAIAVSEAMRGKKKSPEHVAKGAAWRRGRNRPPFSQKWRDNIGKSALGRAAWNNGIPHTLEHRAAISQSLIGNKSRTGQTRSTEERAKQSAAMRGRKRPPRSSEWVANWAEKMRPYWDRNKSSKARLALGV